MFAIQRIYVYTTHFCFSDINSVEVKDKESGEKKIKTFVNNVFLCSYSNDFYEIRNFNDTQIPMHYN